MNTPHNLKRIIAGALLSGGVAVAGLGLGAGTAQALPDGPYTWCPGQPRNAHMPPGGQPGPASPGPSVEWDWNVCHSFWIVSWGEGNVDGPDRSLWDGDNPPAPIPQPWTPLPGL
jgi:hypothetical protein